MIVEGRLQREGITINIIARSFTDIDERIGQGQQWPSWEEIDDRAEDADATLLVFKEDDLLKQADTLSVQPNSHKYR